MEWNASRPKDFEQKVPKPLVVEVKVNGHTARALLDSGSLRDFISTTLVDLLKLEKERLAKPIGLQMAVSGSRSSINYSTSVNLSYQSIAEKRRLDVINLESYDMILGSPFLFQHKVTMCMNPPGVHVGSAVAEEMRGELVTTIASCATELLEDELEKGESRDICLTAASTPLPPLRVINHRIPLINDNKIYAWRNSRCPEALRGEWEKKFQAYLGTGRWEYATGKNTVPMLFIAKKG
ncbi:hypothetical protein BDV93DRAFT_428861, partial [Ceratobasidium sp. AG-I]